jgi:hypothetical protein
MARAASGRTWLGSPRWQWPAAWVVLFTLFLALALATGVAVTAGEVRSFTLLPAVGSAMFVGLWAALAFVQQEARRSDPGRGTRPPDLPK